MRAGCEVISITKLHYSCLQKFRKVLTKMFREADQDMVIFETAVFIKRHPHMFLECIPMPKETGELAPIYFKVQLISALTS